MDVQLKPIAEDNFLAAFNLKLNPDQEKYVSHPVRAWRRPDVYRDQCQPFSGSIAAMKWWATSWSYTITTFPNTTYGT